MVRLVTHALPVLSIATLVASMKNLEADSQADAHPGSALATPGFGSNSSAALVRESRMKNVECFEELAGGCHLEQSPKHWHPATCSTLDPSTFWSGALMLGLASVWLPIVLWVWTTKPHSHTAEPVVATGGAEGDGKAAPGAKVQKKRLEHLDNAKFILMCGVLLPHSRLIKYWQWDSAVQHIANPFVTRAFAFLSGIVARDAPSEKGFRSLFFRLMAPLAIYCVVLEPILVPLATGWGYGSLSAYTDHILKNLTMANAGAMWYMFGLIAWRVWGWMLHPLRDGWKLTTALLFAMVCGYAHLDAFKMNQAIATFPFYVAGQIFPYDLVMERVQWTPSSCVIGALFFVAVFGWGATSAGGAFLDDVPWWSWNKPEDGWMEQRAPCGGTEASFFWVRGMCRNAVEMTKTLVFVFLLIPRGRMGFISDLGSQTLYPYMLHYSVVRLQNRLINIPEGFQAPNFVWVLMWLAEFTFCFLVVSALSSAPVRKTFKVLFEPTWLEEIMGAPKEEAKIVGKTMVTSGSQCVNSGVERV